MNCPTRTFLSLGAALLLGLLAVACEPEPAAPAAENESAESAQTGETAPTSAGESSDDELARERARARLGGQRTRATPSALAIERGHDGEQRVPISYDAFQQAAVDSLNMRRHLLFQCYLRAVEGNVEQPLDLTVRVHLASDGSVADVEPAGDVERDSAAHACVTERITETTFPATPDDLELLYPLSFAGGRGGPDDVRAPVETPQPSPSRGDQPE